MEKQIQEGLNSLIQVYGEEKVKAAANAVINRPAVPAEYLKVLSPQALVDSINQLDAAAQDIIEKGQAKEAAFNNKGDLLKQKRQLETAVELKEAEAYMNIRGAARSQYVMVGDEKVDLPNEETRKAYARTYGKEERQKLAEVEAQLAQLDAKGFQANDDWETAVEASNKVENKAKLQAALLSFLAK